MSAKKLEKRIYTSESALKRPKQLIRLMLSEASRSRELAYQLALRDIRALYRQSILGFFWAFLIPITNALVWIVLNSSGITNIDNTEIGYVAYAFSGTILWSIFTESVIAPLRLTNSSKPLLSKINFPKEALIVSGVIQSLFSAAIKILVLIPTLLILGVNPDVTLVFHLFTILSLVLSGTVLGLLLTPVGVLYSDVGNALGILLLLLMYVSPVVFPIPYEGPAAIIFEINPLTSLIVTARESVTGQSLSMLPEYFLINAVLLLLLIIVWLIYRVAMPIVIERMSV